MGHTWRPMELADCSISIAGLDGVLEPAPPLTPSALRNGPVFDNLQYSRGVSVVLCSIAGGVIRQEVA